MKNKQKLGTLVQSIYLNSLFGPAGTIIIIGLLVMLRAVCYTLYLFLKKVMKKLISIFLKLPKK